MTHPTILVLGNRAYEASTSHSGLEQQTLKSHRLILASCTDEIYGFDFSKIPAVVICRAQEDGDEAYAARKERIMSQIDSAIRKLLRGTAAYQACRSEQEKAEYIVANRPTIVEVNAGSREDQARWCAERDAAVQDAIKGVKDSNKETAVQAPAVRQHVEQNRQNALQQFAANTVKEVEVNDPEGQTIHQAPKPVPQRTWGACFTLPKMPASFGIVDALSSTASMVSLKLNALADSAMRLFSYQTPVVAVLAKEGDKEIASMVSVEAVPMKKEAACLSPSFVSWAKSMMPWAGADQSKTKTQGTTAAPVEGHGQALDMTGDGIKSQRRYMPRIAVVGQAFRRH